MESLNLQVIAAYMFNVGILFILLRLILYKPVKKFLDEREARYARRVEEIERRDHDTMEQKTQYEALVGQIQEESESALRESRSKANRRAEDIIARAEEQAQELIRKAHKEIADERRLARQEMREEIVDLAVDIASRILEREVSVEDHNRLVNNFLSSDKVG